MASAAALINPDVQLEMDALLILDIAHQPDICTLEPGTVHSHSERAASARAQLNPDVQRVMDILLTTDTAIRIHAIRIGGADDT